MTAVGTVSLPVTSTTSRNLDKKLTAKKQNASPARNPQRRSAIRSATTAAPRRPFSRSSHMARWASPSSLFRSRRAMRKVKLVSSSQHSFQNWSRFWAHRFKSRSGKAPVTWSST